MEIQGYMVSCGFLENLGLIMRCNWFRGFPLFNFTDFQGLEEMGLVGICL